MKTPVLKKINPDDVAKTMKRSHIVDTIKHRQEMTRLKLAKSGKYMSRAPIGYDTNQSKSLTVNKEKARHVMTIFAVLLKSRIGNHPLGKYSFSDVHAAFLQETGARDVTKTETSFIRAILGRRTYIGEVWYKKRKQGTCAAIIPRILFDMFHESSAIISSQTHRPNGYQETKRNMALADYKSTFEASEKAIELMLAMDDADGEGQDEIMQTLGFDLKKLSTKLFTFRSDGPLRKRREFKCLKKMDVKK